MFLHLAHAWSIALKLIVTSRLEMHLLIMVQAICYNLKLCLSQVYQDISYEYVPKGEMMSEMLLHLNLTEI